MRIPEFLSLETERLKQKAINIATGSAVALIGALVGLLAVVFLYVSIFLGLAEVLQPGWAAAATAGIALLSALLLILAARGIIKKEPDVARPPEPRRAIVPDMREEAAELGAAAGEYARHRAVPATAGALFAGLLFGASPRLRRTVWRMLK